MTECYTIEQWFHWELQWKDALVLQSVDNYPVKGAKAVLCWISFSSEHTGVTLLCWLMTMVLRLLQTCGDADDVHFHVSITPSFLRLCYEIHLNMLITDFPYSLSSLNLCESSRLCGVTCNIEKKIKYMIVFLSLVCKRLIFAYKLTALFPWSRPCNLYLICSLLNEFCQNGWLLKILNVWLGMLEQWVLDYKCKILIFWWTFPQVFFF